MGESLPTPWRKISIDVLVDCPRLSRWRFDSGTRKTIWNDPVGLSVVGTDVFDAILIDILNRQDYLFWICWQIMELLEHFVNSCS